LNRNGKKEWGIQNARWESAMPLWREVAGEGRGEEKHWVENYGEEG